jgi:hypothetical protein
MDSSRGTVLSTVLRRLPVNHWYMLRNDSASSAPRTPKALRHRDALVVLFLLLLCIPSPVLSHSPKQDQSPQPLGSLSKIGEVYVNDQRVMAAESTIFTGDKLRTDENGVASFSASGRGTLKFSPNTFAVFTGADQYVADLRSGTVVVSSFSGPSGLALRVGDYIVVPAVQEQQTTAKVERTLAGTSSIACLEGSISVISLQGAAGLLLQAGQSSTISTSGQLNPETQEPSREPPTGAPPVAPPESPTPQPGAPAPTTTNPPSQQKSHKGWIILGLAGGGAAIIAAAAASGGGGHSAVSPSSP